jgi:hypothetical protein
LLWERIRRSLSAQISDSKHEVFGRFDVKLLGGLIVKAGLATEESAVLLGMLTAGARVLKGPSAQSVATSTAVTCTAVTSTVIIANSWRQLTGFNQLGKLSVSIKIV